jgi:hypothetical protein
MSEIPHIHVLIAWLRFRLVTAVKFFLSCTAQADLSGTLTFNFISNLCQSHRTPHFLLHLFNRQDATKEFKESKGPRCTS